MVDKELVHSGGWHTQPSCGNKVESTTDLIEWTWWTAINVLLNCQIKTNVSLSSPVGNVGNFLLTIDGNGEVKVWCTRCPMGTKATTDNQLAENAVSNMQHKIFGFPRRNISIPQH